MTPRKQNKRQTERCACHCDWHVSFALTCGLRRTSRGDPADRTDLPPSARTRETTTTHPGRNARGGLLQQVPQDFLVVCAFSLAEFLFVPLPQWFCFFPHLFVHVFLALVILVLAAWLQIQFVYAPILQIVAERQHAHLVHQMQFARPIEVQYLRHKISRERGEKRRQSVNNRQADWLATNKFLVRQAIWQRFF